MAANLIINGLATHALKRLITVHELPSDNPQTSELAVATEGVMPRDYSGKYFETDLSLGLTESADDVKLIAATCKVTRAYTIVETPVTGQKGSVKESVTAEDYEVTIEVDLASDSDEYPADAVQTLVSLMNSDKVIFVDSDYLRLFDITMMVPTHLDVDEQQTYQNVQHIKLQFKSDDDYEIEVISQ